MNNDLFSVLCLNVTGDANLGNMIRTSCLMGCKNFYIAGRKIWDKRYSVGAHHYMNVHHLPEIYHTTIDTHHNLDCKCGECKTIAVNNLIAFIKEIGMRPVFIEQGGTNALEKTWKMGSTPPIFIYGNESNGIPMSVIREVKDAISDTTVVSVPQLGIMRSHNVATTCTITLWEFARGHMGLFDT